MYFDNLIDLHVHSNASDGTLTPKEVVLLAKEKNLKAIALTDHDTTAGIEEALETGKKADIEIIPGVELSCNYISNSGKEVEVHILGLMLDYKNKEMNDKLESLRYKREHRNEDMVELLRNGGIDITLEKLQEDNKDTVITRAHFAKFLVENGYAKNREEVFDKLIGIGCPYYLPKPFITPEYAIGLIKNAGGIPIIAHPLLYKLESNELEKLILTLKNVGLMGIETYHSTNSEFESSNLKSIAKKYDLLISGGSDFHGGNKPDIDIGSGRNNNLKLDYSILEKLKEVHNK